MLGVGKVSLGREADNPETVTSNGQNPVVRRLVTSVTVFVSTTAQRE